MGIRTNETGKVDQRLGNRKRKKKNMNVEIVHI